jgi:signal peptidase I
MYVELVDDLNGYNVLASFEADVVPAPGDVIVFFTSPDEPRERGTVTKRKFVTHGPDLSYRVDCIIELADVELADVEGYTV